jgi:hypothetical protein
MSRAEYRREYRRRRNLTDPNWRKTENADQLKRIERNRQFVNEFKKNKGCKYCPEAAVCCLDLHHRDGEEKDKAVSYMVKMGYGLERLNEEIQKCDVVCANCHRKLHAGHVLNSR